MPISININSLTLCHKGSGGFSVATAPDVCKTPSPGGPVPIPYPNIAFSADLMKGTTTVKADGGVMCANYGSVFFKSTGDEPGVVGGVVSSTFIKEATWITFSFDVKLQGKPACRLTDKMFHNHSNTVNCSGLNQCSIDVSRPRSCHECVVFNAKWVEGPDVVEDWRLTPPVVPEVVGSEARMCWELTVEFVCHGKVECVCEWCGKKKTVSFSTKRVSRTYKICREAGFLDLVPFAGGGLTVASRRILALVKALRNAGKVVKGAAAIADLSKALEEECGIDGAMIVSGISMALDGVKRLLDGAAGMICNGKFDESSIESLWSSMERWTRPGVGGVGPDLIA